jgi:hypothetical protein
MKWEDHDLCVGRELEDDSNFLFEDTILETPMKTAKNIYYDSQ